MIELYRINQWVSRFRIFEVYLNSTKVGNIKNNNVFHFEVHNGDELQISIDWCTSPIYILGIDLPTSGKLVCGCSTTLLQALKLMVIAPDKFLYVEKCE